MDKHRCYAINMASSQQGGKSALFSSENSYQSVPFSHAREKAIYDNTAGDEMVGLDTHYENLMENLDGLSEEQLDELLREAHDINQRLRSLEGKQTLHGHDSGSEEMHSEENGSTGLRSSRPHFLPPIQQTKTSLVTQDSLIKGVMSSKPERVVRKKKSTVI